MDYPETPLEDEEDVTVNLIRVIYDALESAAMNRRHLVAAERCDDYALIHLLDRAIERELSLARQAKLLLRERLTLRRWDEKVDEAGKESFPASDPPAF